MVLGVVQVAGIIAGSGRCMTSRRIGNDLQKVGAPRFLDFCGKRSVLMIKEMIPLLGRNHRYAATPSFRLYKGVANLRAKRNKRSILYPLATRVVKGKKIVAKKGTEAVGTNDVGLETINLVADGGTTVGAQFLINYPLSYHAGKPATGIISKIGRTERFRSRRSGDCMPGCAGEQFTDRRDVFKRI
jgi:hypothetical protein